jgi:hypothetical protein
MPQRGPGWRADQAIALCNRAHNWLRRADPPIDAAIMLLWPPVKGAPERLFCVLAPLAADLARGRADGQSDDARQSQ